MYAYIGNIRKWRGFTADNTLFALSASFERHIMYVEIWKYFSVMQFIMSRI